MSSFEKLIKAKTLLGLRETASLKEIKLSYKNLMKKWHPDKHRDNVKQATTMSVSINEAYEILLEYCNHYEYDFSEEKIKRDYITPAQWWHDKFGEK
ncbi:MAG: J domain-containing protein [Sulfurimonas sp.]|nr:J domain-containing protein [Sulfurimonas sp.]MDQ7061632.1 J domain-containing protein [Sulfurimonas sp.]